VPAPRSVSRRRIVSSSGVVDEREEVVESVALPGAVEDDHGAGLPCPACCLQPHFVAVVDQDDIRPGHVFRRQFGAAQRWKRLGPREETALAGMFVDEDRRHP